MKKLLERDGGAEIESAAPDGESSVVNVDIIDRVAETGDARPAGDVDRLRIENSYALDLEVLIKKYEYVRTENAVAKDGGIARVRESVARPDVGVVQGVGESVARAFVNAICRGG